MKERHTLSAWKWD